ncbi:MAG: hypothetical protein RBU23_04485 [Candidatus Auribacterota bacterium]|jgi:hypothetical protein|nr:hypothetical protein [Candidatus Auribacterota bacterium]
MKTKKIKNTDRIIFTEDFSLIILKFIMYFSVAMFATGCAMVLFSVERSRILPVALVAGGVCILLILIGEKQLFCAGFTEINLETCVLRQRLFFFRWRSFDMSLLEYVSVERVISRGRILLYNIYMKIGSRRIKLGQETDHSLLETKLRSIRRCVPCPVTETDKQLREYDSSDIVKLVGIVLFLMVLVYLMKTSGSQSSPFKDNTRFLVVILIPLGYFIIFYFFKKGKKGS